GTGGERTIPVGELFVGPGRTARAQDEVLAEVLVPRLGERSGSAYLRLEFRRAMEIAIVGVTAAVRLDPGGAVADCRIALTAVAPVIVRAPDAERLLRGAVGARGNPPTPWGAQRTLLAQAGELAAAASTPIDDVRAPAGYRRETVKVLTVRALRRALERVVSD